jgi:hypothetical protein
MVGEQASGLELSSEFAMLNATPTPIGRTRRISIQFLLNARDGDADYETTLTGEGDTTGSAYYFRSCGSNPATGPHFAQVHYHTLYPDIDLVFYPNPKAFQFDFVVAPQGDPTRIELEFVHADHPRIDDSGNLVIHAGYISLLEHAPIFYQPVDGLKRVVGGSFVLVNDLFDVGFRVSDYDKRLPLIISVR